MLMFYSISRLNYSKILHVILTQNVVDPHTRPIFNTMNIRWIYLNMKAELFFDDEELNIHQAHSQICNQDQHLEIQSNPGSTMFQTGPTCSFL